jgi:hypothetical protein
MPAKPNHILALRRKPNHDEKADDDPAGKPSRGNDDGCSIIL